MLKHIDVKPSGIEVNKINKRGEATYLGAFPLLGCPKIQVKIPRKIGVTEVNLVVRSDLENKNYCLPIELSDTSSGLEAYELTDGFYDLAKGLGYGLFYYIISLKLGRDREYFLSSINNADFYITESYNDVKPFRMIIYSDDFKTPDWAKKTVMYQIFVDRFNKGSVACKAKDDTVLTDNWDECPEYCEKQGDYLKNNTFFGGTLYGVAEKLDYLLDLGVGLIYLNPIFDAYSNHKYDVGNYEEIDGMFGGKAAFDLLIKEASKRGIKIILDGVFNHTGEDSLYFNKFGKYNSIGAYQSRNSPYFSWYFFNNFPDDYESWWGIKMLPKLNNNNPETREFFLGDKGIVNKWLKEGAFGLRLDVADELPKDFLEDLRKRVKSVNPDALIIGEVWENASDKISYGERRRYFLGGQLDSVMNYPIKNAIIDFVKTGNEEGFYNVTMDIYSSYPTECSNVLMNILGTHDTERILTVLGGEAGDGKTNYELSRLFMSEDQREYGIKLLKCATILQFTLPGIPTVYYGDEVGSEGYHDPFCRRTYPWGREDLKLLSHYRRLSKIKNENQALHTGSLVFERHERGLIIYNRTTDNEEIKTVVNCGDEPIIIELNGSYRDLLSDGFLIDTVTVYPKTGYILKPYKKA